MRARPSRTAAIGAVTRRDAPRIVTRSPPSESPLIEPRELWLAVHLPQLPLDATTGAAPSPRAVVELQDGTSLIIAADEAARQAGVRAGMGAAAALALLPQLHTQAREPHREQALLTHLARLAQRFTPRVSLAPPDAVLLEVRGSLRLFGGHARLREQLLTVCASAAVKVALALAPTALAALAGARAGVGFVVMEEARLVGALAPLGLAVLRWPSEVLERLAKIGVRSIGAALRLPRAGFARRFGAEQLAALDHLVGRSADLRRTFQPTERFRARHAFTYELEHHAAVLAALTPLIEDLSRFLAARQCGITALECRLRHRHAPPTRCVLKLAAPESDAQPLCALLGERLAALVLPEPVRGCEVRSGELTPRAPQAHGLWQPGEQGGGPCVQAPALIERLRARLGVQAVHGLELRPGHRPEGVSRAAELHEARTPPPPWAVFRRPLWLLPVPQLLMEKDGRPCRRGPLRVLGEPERIETGWWESVGAGASPLACGAGDLKEVVRDYYHAIDARGARLWIFRERMAPHHWFLHGVFG